MCLSFTYICSMRTQEQLTRELELQEVLNGKWPSIYSQDYSDLVDKLFSFKKINDLVFLPRITSHTFYEGLVEIRSNSRSLVKKLKRIFLESDTDFNRIIECLNKCTTEELKSIYKEYNTEENNEKVLFLIQVFIAKKEALEWLSKFIKESVFSRFIQFLNITFKRNVRFFFRKILSLHFKNLDDYHSFSIL